MNSLVSCVITTYKRPPSIVKRAAESVLNQTYKNLELIIVDDSPESYEERCAVRCMVDSLKGNVIYIPHKANQGACAARNTGLKHANGDFVAYLDDDDEWLPEKIEKQMLVFDKCPDVALVYCDRYICYENDQIVKQNIKFYRGKVFDKLILNNFIGSTSFPLIKKSVLDDIGGFDIAMKAAQDYEVWLRIAKDYSVDYVPDSLVNYHIHSGEQITDNPIKKIEALERLNEMYKNYFTNHSRAYAIRNLRLALFYCSINKEYAKKLFWLAFRRYPFVSIEFLRAVKNIYLSKH